MNPAESLAAIGSFPSRRTNAVPASMVSGDVAMLFTTSTSGIIGTGLKK